MEVERLRFEKKLTHPRFYYCPNYHWDLVRLVDDKQRRNPLISFYWYNVRNGFVLICDLKRAQSNNKK